MSKKRFLVIGCSALFAAAVAFNINTNRNNISLSGLTLENIEALAQTETAAEFTAATCCEAIWEQVNCKGCDGNTWSYARPF